MLVSVVQAAVSGGELALHSLPTGSAFEMHPDQSGNLWITDLGAGEIWRVNSAGSDYTIYAVGGAPADASPDNQGGVWWLDVPENGTPKISKMDTTTGDSLTWSLDGTSIPYGLAFDDLGYIWISDGDSTFPNLYRFNPTNREFCTFSLPASGWGYYPAADGNLIWLGDVNNGRLLRLNSTTNRIDWWVLPLWTFPEALSIDMDGNIWFTDSAWQRIGKLIPGTGDLTLFEIPSGSLPKLISVDSGWVWYSEQYLASFGLLNPAVAQGVLSKPLTDGLTLNPGTCPSLSKPLTGRNNLTQGSQSWGSTSYNTVVDANGWKIYQLPTESFPWGILYKDSSVWLVDNGRQKLVKVPVAQAPALVLDKTAIQTTYDSPGDVIDYSYVLSNGGDVILSGPFTITDDKTTNESCPSSPNSLAPGEFITCASSYTIAQAEIDAGQVTNTANGHAYFGTSPVDSNQDSATVYAQQSAALTLVKTANPLTYDSVNDIISYTFLVTNSGNVRLSGPITISDDKTTNESCPAVTTIGNHDIYLDPAEGIICTASYSTTQADVDAGSVINTATAHAGVITSNVDSATVTAIKLPSLTVDKTGTPVTFTKVGDLISYSYTVTNAGNTTLYDLTVIDNKTSVSCPNTSAGLAPSGSITCTATYTITQLDVNAGFVTNTAYATDGITQSALDSFTCTYQKENYSLFLPMIRR